MGSGRVSGGDRPRHGSVPQYPRALRDAEDHVDQPLGVRLDRPNALGGSLIVGIESEESESGGGTGDDLGHEVGPQRGLQLAGITGCSQRQAQVGAGVEDRRSTPDQSQGVIMPCGAETAAPRALGSHHLRRDETRRLGHVGDWIVGRSRHTNGTDQGCSPVLRCSRSGSDTKLAVDATQLLRESTHQSACATLRSGAGPSDAVPRRWLMKPGLVLAALLALVLLGACSNGQQPAPDQSAGSPTAQRPGSYSPDPTVAWSEQLCHALLPVAQSAGTPPVLAAVDPEGSRQRFHISLHNQVDALTTALTWIAAAGPAPVDKGAQVDQVLTTTLSRWRDTLAAGLAELDAVPPGEPETLRYTLTGVTSLLVPADGKTLLGLAVPVSLQSPARQAPSCQTLEAAN